MYAILLQSVPLATSQHSLPLATSQHSLPLVMSQHSLPLVTSQHSIPLVTSQHSLPLVTSQHSLPLVMSQHSLPLVMSQHSLYCVMWYLNDNVKNVCHNDTKILFCAVYKNTGNCGVLFWKYCSIFLYYTCNEFILYLKSWYNSRLLMNLRHNNVQCEKSPVAQLSTNSKLVNLLLIHLLAYTHTHSHRNTFT